ncbi:hypothetical protein evm_013695 [Chilo suppressalis]|nr:hypothetical protein evm_013695 [Chilo suppressalis]
MDAIFKPMVIVTGFGPFVGHQVNASWEAVKLMNKEKIENEHNIELVQLELSVTYEDVNKYVPALWETHSPQVRRGIGRRVTKSELTSLLLDHYHLGHLLVCYQERYLCEYIYYTSLSIDNSCTLFVHVPDMEVYSSEQTARGLERILALCLEQLRKTDTDVDINEKLKDVTLEKDNRL